MSDASGAGAADKIVLPKPRAASAASAEAAGNRINMPKPRQPGEARPQTLAKENPKPPAPPKPGLRQKLLLAAPLLCGIVGYFATSALTGSTAEKADDDHHGPTLPIDEAIDDYRFDLVLAEVRSLQKKAVGDARAALRFREAICLESLDKSQEAAEIYADLADAAPTSPRGVAARLGEVRCLARLGRLADARKLVSQLILSSNIPALTDSKLQGEVLITKAVIELALLPAIPAPHPARLDGFATSLRRPDFPRHLAWAGALPAPAKHGHDAHAGPSHDQHHAPTKAKDDHHPQPKHGEPAKPKDDGHGQPKHAEPATPEPKKKDAGHDDHHVVFLGDQHPTPTAPKKDTSSTGLAIDDGQGLDDVSRIVVGKARARNVADALSEVARAAGLSLQIARSVAERLESRPIELNVRDTWLSDLLDAMTNPLGTIWSIADGRLLVLPEPTDTEYKRNRARQAIANALEVVTDHPWQPALINELGTIDACEGRYREAIEWYRRVASLSSNPPETAHAAYNIGLIHVRQGERSRAREQMMALVDRAPSSKWASLAYWWIGRTYLDGGDPARALVAFQQSSSINPDSPAGMASILGEAIAALQQKDHSSALALLKKHAKPLKTEGYRPIAAFLIAVGRYHTAPTPSATGESEDLLFATMEMPNQTMLGPALAEIHADALLMFGFRSNAMDVYGLATQNLRGPLASRLILADAELYWADGRRAEARERFLAVALTDNGSEGRKARLRLGTIALENGQYSAALQYGKESLSGNDREQALKIMGRAYEAMKDYARAAQCFAGEVPD